MEHKNADEESQLSKIKTPQAIILAGIIIAIAVAASNAKIYRVSSQEKNDEKSGRISLIQETVAPTLAEVSEKDHIRGNKNASVVLVEYSDTECPYCKMFHRTMRDLVKKDTDIAWVYRHFPLPIHPKAPKEAEASECAAELGGEEMFWKYVDRIFEITPANNGLPESALYDIARELGLDDNNFRNCLSDGKYKNKVDDQVKDGIAAQVTGTPQTVMLVRRNGNLEFFNVISGAQPITTIEELVRAARNRTKN